MSPYGKKISGKYRIMGSIILMQHFSASFSPSLTFLESVVCPKVSPSSVVFVYFPARRSSNPFSSQAIFFSSLFVFHFLRFCFVLFLFFLFFSYSKKGKFWCKLNHKFFRNFKMGINGSFIGVVFEKTMAFFAFKGERNDEFGNLSGQVKDRTQLRMRTVSHDTFGKLVWDETDCYANKSGVKREKREKVFCLSFFLLICQVARPGTLTLLIQ